MGDFNQGGKVVFIAYCAQNKVQRQTYGLAANLSSRLLRSKRKTIEDLSSFPLHKLFLCVCTPDRDPLQPTTYAPWWRWGFFHPFLTTDSLRAPRRLTPEGDGVGEVNLLTYIS